MNQANEDSGSKRAAGLVFRDKEANHGAEKLEENQTSRKNLSFKQDRVKQLKMFVCLFVWTAATCKELPTSEAWFDAEEDLQAGGPAAVAAMGQSPNGNSCSKEL